MTYEEANRTENIIKRLNKRRMCPCGYCTDDKCVPEPLMDACLKQDFVINKAIEALEKQIPKKPYKNRSEYFCPSCEDSPCVGKNHRDGHKTRDDFCFRCGQALDWSNEPPKEEQ